MNNIFLILHTQYTIFYYFIITIHKYIPYNSIFNYFIITIHKYIPYYSIFNYFIITMHKYIPNTIIYHLPLSQYTTIYQ